MNNDSLADMIRYYGLKEAVERLEKMDSMNLPLAQGIILSGLEKLSDAASKTRTEDQ